MYSGTIHPSQLLGPPKTAEYEPPDTALSAHLFHPNRPFFTLQHIDAMLTDARVVFGLKLIRGPILSNARFIINTKNKLLKEYLVTQVNRFWRTSAAVALRNLDYGYLGTEVLYRAYDNRLQFDRLKFLHPHTTRVVTRKGEMLGIEVSRVASIAKLFLGVPKCLWTIHQRDQHCWYGRSLLRGAFLAWNEIWCDHGYRDQRRLWFYKNAYAGIRVGYPSGSAPAETNDPTATPKPYRVIAQDLIDKAVSGSGIAYPMGGEWEFEDARPIAIPEGLLEYGDQLRDEIWEGMGIPPEVARAEGTGAFAGRRIPQQAFYSVLQEIVQDLITDLDEQILQPLVRMNFGNSEDYEIECFGLLRTSPEEEKGAFEKSQEQPIISGLEVPFSKLPAHARNIINGAYRTIPLPKRVVMRGRPRIESFDDVLFHASSRRAA